MKYLEVYQAVQATGPLRDTFIDWTRSPYIRDRLRAVLRTMEAHDLEDAIFHNHTDVVWYGDYENIEAITNQFKKINQVYQYFEEEPDTMDLYRQIYQYNFLKDAAAGNPCHYLDEITGPAYRLLFYFGSTASLQAILEATDKYEGQYDAKHSLFSFRLPQKLEGETLAVWRDIIHENLTPEVLRLFSFADVIALKGIKAPQTLEEARHCEHLLLANKKLEHQVITRLFNSLDTQEHQNQFLEKISPVNFREWIRNDREFIDTLPKIQDEATQSTLLKRLGQAKILGWYQASPSKNKFLRAVHHPHNYKHLLKDLIGFEALWPLNRGASAFSFEMRMSLIHGVTAFEVLKEIFPVDTLRELVTQCGDLQYLLPNLPEKNRFTFLQEVLGLDHCKTVINQPHEFALMAQSLPQDQRYECLTWLFTDDQLKQFPVDHASFKFLKSCLQSEERIRLNTLVYPPATLEAKATLKNIKKTILETDFNFSVFEPQHRIKLSGRHVIVPTPVMEQIRELDKVCERKQEHQQALSKLRNIGAQAAQQPAWLVQFKTLFSVQGPAQCYYNKFSNDESFNSAFKKKSG